VLLSSTRQPSARNSTSTSSVSWRHALQFPRSLLTVLRRLLSSFFLALVILSPCRKYTVGVIFNDLNYRPPGRPISTAIEWLQCI